MRLLADTHAYLWWLEDSPRLGTKARDAMADPASEVLISAASIWEISIKIELGKLDFGGDPVEEISANGFRELPMTCEHAALAGRLPRHHEDPFDRMLIAQTQLEGLVLVSCDANLPAYGVPMLF